MFIATALILKVCAVAHAQSRPNERELQEQMAELRESFAQDIAAARANSTSNARQIAERLKIDALIAIINEERRGAFYSKAIEELAKHPDSHAAVRALVANIDEPPSPAPSFTGSPLEHFPAARALLKCGPRARTHIYNTLLNSQSDRRLHIMAYVLAQLDQDEHRPFSVDLTVRRLTREAEWIANHPIADRESTETYVKNFKQMISIMQDAQFSVKDFPPP
jgi:hypothetical protein